MQARRHVLVSDDDQERVILSVDGLTEMLRFNFRVAPFPQDALEEVRTALLREAPPVPPSSLGASASTARLLYGPSGRRRRQPVLLPSELSRVEHVAPGTATS